MEESLSAIIQSSEYSLFFGKCPFCGSFIYVERILTTDKHGNQRWVQNRYVGIPLRSKQVISYKKGFESLFGGFPLSVTVDEERLMLMVPSNTYKRIVEAYKNKKFSEFEWLLFKVSDADQNYVNYILNVSLQKYEEESEGKET